MTNDPLFVVDDHGWFLEVVEDSYSSSDCPMLDVNVGDEGHSLGMVLGVESTRRLVEVLNKWLAAQAPAPDLGHG